MSRLTLALFVTLSPAAFAAGPPLDRFCAPLDANGCEVVWAGPTNSLPERVNIFRVIPAKFTRETVSNVLYLAGLTERDRKKAFKPDGFVDPDIQTFSDQKGTRHVDFVPSQGTIAVTKQTARAAPRESPVGVPTPSEALELALRLLPKLGLSKGDIATNTQGAIKPQNLTEETDFYRDKASGKIATNVLARGVWLKRQIEGIPVWGAAGLDLTFANLGEIAHLRLTWRAVQPFEQIAVPTTHDFVSRIKAGKALVRDNNLPSFKKLSITKATLYYWENSGSEPQRFIYPFAVLEAETGVPDHKARIQIFVSFANE